MICLDEMGPESAKSFPGPALVHTQAPADGTGAPAKLAKQEADYGRRGKGYIFGAFRPATGEAFTVPYPGRTIANWTDFLERVDGWLPSDAARVFAIQDNLSTHRATDVLLFSLAHPRWEFVFQPQYAGGALWALNLIEPWWKVLRSLALKGRRFESWDEICQAVRDATMYWNAHRHPFIVLECPPPSLHLGPPPSPSAPPPRRRQLAKGGLDLIEAPLSGASTKSGRIVTGGQNDDSVEELDGGRRCGA